MRLFFLSFQLEKCTHPRGIETENGAGVAILLFITLSISAASGGAAASQQMSAFTDLDLRKVQKD